MNSLETKINFLHNFYDIDDEKVLKYLANKLHYIKVTKRNIRITDNYNKDYSFFVVSGCVKSIYVISNDEEYTEFFIKEGGIIYTDDAFYLNKLFEVETYTTCPSEFYRIRKSDLDTCLFSIPQIKKKFDLQHEYRADCTRKIKYAICTMSCIDRFNWFKKTYSQYMKYLTHEDIANILSIRETHLSYLVNKNEDL